MLNQRLSAARRIAADIKDTERTADMMVGQLARLIAGLSEARIATNVAASVGQAAFVSAGEAMTLAMQLRGRLVAAHESLAMAKAETGLSAYAIGDGSDCPPVPATVGDAGPLRLVSGA